MIWMNMNLMKKFKNTLYVTEYTPIVGVSIKLMISGTALFTSLGKSFGLVRFWTLA